VRRFVAIFIVFWWVSLIACVGAVGYQVNRSWVDFKQSMGRALKAAEDPIVQYDPELGWRNFPGKTVAQMTPFIGPVQINRNGFRGSVDYETQKPANKFRIAALGDSFTFGMVPNAQTIPAKLEALSPKLEVINMGTCAYGVDQMYLLYRSTAVNFDADLTILSVIGGDLQRVFMHKWLSGHGRPQFSLSNGELKLSNVPVPVPKSYNNIQHAFSPGRTKTYMTLMIMEILRLQMIKRKPEGLPLKFLLLNLKLMRKFDLEKGNNILVRGEIITGIP